MASSRGLRNLLRLPFWGANLLGFGVLIAIVLAAFFWQMTQMRKSLHHNTQVRARMVATLIEKNLENADLSRQTIEALITASLEEKAEFIRYLDEVEPLQADELSAYAAQTGLTGVTLHRAGGARVEGPAGWSRTPGNCHDLPLTYNADGKLGILTHQTPGPETRCIQLGFDAGRILSLRERTALPVLLETIAALPGIRYVRLEPGTMPQTTDIRLLQEGDRAIAESILATGSGALILGLDASNHVRHRQRMARQFALFAALLLGIGLFVSWLLHRYQHNILQTARRYEQSLAREREDASLGRAAATIAHEIKNPLNAINIGLQRLDMESDNLDETQLELIAAIRAEVVRTAAIIGELQGFARPLQPQPEPLDLGTLLQRQLVLHQSALEQAGIRVTCRLPPSVPVTADAALLTEVLQNLLKNSLEAQPQGGFLDVTCRNTGQHIAFSLENGGYTLSAADEQRLGEPYFTTKTRGSGLGLARCRRILEAHGGQLLLHPSPEHNTLTVTFSLPRTGPGEQAKAGDT